MVVAVAAEPAQDGDDDGGGADGDADVGDVGARLGDVCCLDA